MAESNDLERTIKALEKEVTCVICQDIFQDPKLLPCDHCYCKKCIVGICRETSGNKIKCPECRIEQTILQHRVDRLRTASKVSRLVNMHRSLSEAYDKERAKLPKESEGSSVCSEHGDFMMLYCMSCQSFICRDCAITKHKDHEYEYNSTTAVKRTEELLQSKTFFEEVRKDFEDALKEVSKTSAALESQGQRMENFLANYFRQLRKFLDEHEMALQKKIKEIRTNKIGKLKKQENNLLTGLDKLSKVIKRIEQHLSGSNSDIVMSSNLMKQIDHQKELFKMHPKPTKKFSNLELLSHNDKYVDYELVPVVIHFSEVEVQPLPELWSPVKKLIKIVPLEVVKSKKKINIRKFEREVYVNQKCSFHLLSEEEGNFEGTISTPLPDPHKVRKCLINRIGSITYKVEYISPLTPGVYRIIILLNGIDVTGASLSLTVQEPD